MRTIGWGVIGCGGIADRRTIPEGIIPAENSELIAVMGPHEEKVRKVAEKYDVENWYTKEEEILSDPNVDAVYIASPNRFHRDQTVAAAEHGKHVLCEKPMAMSVDEAAEMVSACKENGVKFAVGFMMRFHSCHREALSLVDRGLLGDLVAARIQFAFWYPPMPGAWRQDPALGGGGSLMDLGIHSIDLLRMFLGEVVELFAFNGTLCFDYAVEDSSLITMKFESGAYGIVDSFFNMRNPAAGGGVELNGTEGSLVTRGTIGQSSDGTVVLNVEGAEQERILSPTPVNIYRAEVEDLVRSILDDSEPTNSAEEGLKNQRVAMAAYESSRTGRRISLE